MTAPVSNASESNLQTLAPNEAQAVLSRARGIIDIEIEALEDLKNNLDGDFLKAVMLMEGCKGRVIVTGMGKSGHIGKKIAATLSSTGTPAYFLHPAEGSHGDLGMISPQDVVLAISNSGETPEILAILPLIKRFEIPLIAMTAKADSALSRQADVTLSIAVKQEACPHNLAPTASTTATLALGDTLAVVLLERKGFSEEDFALFHPAGTLGKRLLLRVRDIMHGEVERLPVVDLNTSFLDALVEIGSKQLGMVIVVADKNQDPTLVGILTDGDVRRALTQYTDARSIPLADVITRNPKTIGADELAVAAIRTMENHKITALLVRPETLDAKLPVAGIVHLHDILKTGIR